MAKAGVEVLTWLLANKNIDVLCNACWALFHLLDGLKHEEVGSVMRNPGFPNHIFDLLQRGMFGLEQPILKALNLFTKVGCIDDIVICNGIPSISKTLLTPHEDHQKLSCCTMPKIICGNRDRLQDVKLTKKYSLWAFLSTPAQIKYLVAQNCVKKLCFFLTTDIEPIEIRIGRMRICNTETATECERL
jgi:hypothetical protein